MYSPRTLPNNAVSTSQTKRGAEDVSQQKGARLPTPQRRILNADNAQFGGSEMSCSMGSVLKAVVNFCSRPMRRLPRSSENIDQADLT